jgi:hypothetical protein
MIFQMFGCLVVVIIGYNDGVVQYTYVESLIRMFCIYHVKNSIRKHGTFFESFPETP